jgi:hypothetical protein
MLTKVDGDAIGWSPVAMTDVTAFGELVSS